MSPLFDAIYNNDPVELQELLASGEDPNQVSYVRDGETPAEFAARLARLDCLRVLVECGASLKWALVSAVCNRDVAPGDVLNCVRLLLNAGVDADDKNCALKMAGNVEVMRVLIEAGADINARDVDGGTPLIHSAYHRNPDCLEFLLSQGADIDAQSTHGNTALIAAAGYNRPACVEALLKAGADIHKTDRWGRTAGGCAAKFGYTECLALLRAAAKRDP